LCNCDGDGSRSGGDGRIIVTVMVVGLVVMDV
jgi:hypothetical protein